MTELGNNINVAVTEVLSKNKRIIFSLTEAGNKGGKVGLKIKETQGQVYGWQD